MDIDTTTLSLQQMPISATSLVLVLGREVVRNFCLESQKHTAHFYHNSSMEPQQWRWISTISELFQQEFVKKNFTDYSSCGSRLMDQLARKVPHCKPICNSQGVVITLGFD